MPGSANSADMSSIRKTCVYCGTQEGHNPQYLAGAATLGRSFAKAGVSLVYGGASIGVMGALARAALDAGGHVTGIIPEFLTERESAFADVSELVVTDSMHERKQLMFDMADSFVALPGGIGTLEELVEMLTWFQLGQHEKPIVLGNISNFWAPFIELIEHMHEEGFITNEAQVHYKIASRTEDILPLLEERARELASAK